MIQLGIPQPDNGIHLKNKLAEWLKTDINKLHICPWIINGVCNVDFSIQNTTDEKERNGLYMEFKKLLIDENSELYKYNDPILGKYVKLRLEQYDIYLIFSKN